MSLRLVLLLVTGLPLLAFWGCGDDEQSPIAPDISCPAPIVDLMATPLGTSASLSWTATGEDGANNPGVIYNVKYSTSVITPTNFFEASFADSFADNSQPGKKLEIEVENLPSDTRLNFALVASDYANNTSRLSNIASMVSGPSLSAYFEDAYSTRAVETDSDGNFYLAGLVGMNRVRQFSENGEEVWEHVSQYETRDLAVGPDGTIYVLGASTITRLLVDGSVEGFWQLDYSSRPRYKRITVDGFGTVFVLKSEAASSGDYSIYYICRLDDEGVIEAEWPVADNYVNPDGDMGNLVQDLEADCHGNVYALLHGALFCPNCQYAVLVFGRNGDLVSKWGHRLTEFHWPHGIAVGPDGLVYICDFDTSIVQVFTWDGEFITMWATPCRGPLDVSVDPNGRVYVNAINTDCGGGVYIYR